MSSERARSIRRDRNGALRESETTRSSPRRIERRRAKGRRLDGRKGGREGRGGEGNREESREKSVLVGLLSRQPSHSIDFFPDVYSTWRTNVHVHIYLAHVYICICIDVHRYISLAI